LDGNHGRNLVGRGDNFIRGDLWRYAESKNHVRIVTVISAKGLGRERRHAQ
jgi:hypothetical protein